MNIIKLDDLTPYHIAVIMYRFNNLLLLLLLQLIICIFTIDVFEWARFCNAKSRHKKPINIKNGFTKRDTNCYY